MKFLLWCLGVALAIDALLRTWQATGAERVFWSVWLFVWILFGVALAGLAIRNWVNKMKKLSPGRPPTPPTAPGGNK